MPRIVPPPAFINGTINSSGPTSVVLTVKGYGGQTADLAQFLDFSDGNLLRINKDGWVGIGPNAPLTALHVEPAVGSTSYSVFAGNANGFNPPTSIVRGMLLGWNRSGAQGESILAFSTASGSSPRLEIASWDANTSAFSPLVSIFPNGAITCGTITATNLSGTNTGDLTLAGETYLSLAGQVITAAAVNLSGSQATGTIAAGRFPALTGNVTTSAGSLATTIAAGVVTNAMLAGSIAASKLVGSDIVTVGTITSGVWNAGAVTSSGRITATDGALVGSGTAYGLLDYLPTGGATAWAYFRNNVAGNNPSGSVNLGLMFGWNRSGVAGESSIIFGTGVGTFPYIEFASWNGSVVTPVFAILPTGINLSEGMNFIGGTTTGTKFGTATTQKLAFHGATAVVQRAGAAQAAVATTAATNTTPYGYTTAAQADAVIALLNEIQATLVEKGIMKGSS